MESTPKTRSYNTMSDETLQCVTRTMARSSEDYQLASSILKERGVPVLKHVFWKKKKRLLRR